MGQQLRLVQQSSWYTSQSNYQSVACYKRT